MISTPSRDATLYAQLREEGEKHLCQLASRKVTVATLVGDGELALRHHRLGRKRRPTQLDAPTHPFTGAFTCVSESEAARSDPSEHASDPGLISLLRAELGLSSSDLFSMTVTDYDMKPGVGITTGEAAPGASAHEFIPVSFLPQRVFEAPPSAPALFEHIDTFPSRRSEKEKERKSPPPCSQRDLQPGAQNSLLR